MSLFIARTRGAVLALAVVMFSACADQENPTATSPHRRASLSVGDVLLVTNTSGGNLAGSLRALVSQATGGEVIHFDPSLAGSTITLDTTLDIPNRVTIEAPVDKGITISGGGKSKVLSVRHGATLVNLTITEERQSVSTTPAASSPAGLWSSTIARCRAIKV